MATGGATPDPVKNAYDLVIVDLVVVPVEELFSRK